MSTSSHVAATSVKAVYQLGDYVLYRDAAALWAGQPDHTYACKVVEIWPGGVYDLVCLQTKRRFANVTPDYMRWLPPADAMHDIDTAALEEPTALSPAAVAWIRQHGTPVPVRPALPPAS